MNHLKLTLTALLTAALVVTSLPLQVFAQTPPSVKPFRTVSVLKVKNPDTEPIDLTNSLYTEAFTKPENWTNYDKSIVEVFRNSFRKALTGGNWAFVQGKYPDKEHYHVRVFWTENQVSGLKLFYHNGLYNLCSTTSDGFYSLDVYWYQNRPTMSSGSLNGSLYSCIPLSGHWSGLDYSTFLSNFEYTKSKELDGVDVFIPHDSGQKQLVAPQFSISYNALNVTLAHKAELDPSITDMQTAIDEVVAAESVNNPLPAHREVRKGYYIELRILQDDVKNDSPYEHIKHIKPAEIYTHKLPALGTYNLTATYVIAECDKNTNPQDMSTCSVRRLTYSKNYEFSPRHAKIVVDGNSGAYDTDKMQCTNDGTDCVPPPLYENCSAHDIKIHFWSGGPEFSLPSISSIWCTMKNWGVLITHEIIRPLFIPNAYRVSLLFDQTKSNAMNSLGFLGEPFKMVAQIYDFVMGDKTISSTCELPPITIFGASSSIQLCAWRYQMPQVWKFMQIIIQGAIGLSFLWVLYRLVMRMFGVDIPEYEETHEPADDVSRHSTTYVRGKEGKRIW